MQEHYDQFFEVSVPRVALRSDQMGVCTMCSDTPPPAVRHLAWLFAHAAVCWQSGCTVANHFTMRTQYNVYLVEIMSKYCVRGMMTIRGWLMEKLLCPF